jgi:hypothetical protein
MNELCQAVYNHFNASTGHGAYTSVSGRFYLNHAPQGASFPFVVYFEVTDSNDMDFAEEREDFLLQFNIFSQNNSALEAGNILTNLKSLFDECSLTVTNWRHIQFSRANVYPNNDFDEVPPVHGYSVEYNVLIEKTKS